MDGDCLVLGFKPIHAMYAFKPYTPSNLDLIVLVYFILFLSRYLGFIWCFVIRIHSQHKKEKKMQ